MGLYDGFNMYTMMIEKKNYDDSITIHSYTI